MRVIISILEDRLDTVPSILLFTFVDDEGMVRDASSPCFFGVFDDRKEQTCLFFK